MADSVLFFVHHHRVSGCDMDQPLVFVLNAFLSENYSMQVVPKYRSISYGLPGYLIVFLDSLILVVSIQ